ncbi:ACP phosphodiesterase [Chitinophaga caseinilytica]|uniref:acyl carrier protein phosphodiesterase n=1 Tax=Chitinophaga caseinilytica TaxID=2267521 RepID=UPI003C30AF52
MNYLAHAYLSFHDPDITAGQLIADFVKGKKTEDYPAPLRKGIVLHRALDDYTDHHPASKTARELFRPSSGLYGGVFLDVVYDHFLANDPQRFSLPTLARFAEETYAAVNERLPQLPPAFRQMFSFMQSQNWLYHYYERISIFRSFGGIVRRSKYYPHPADVPYGVFNDHYAALRDCYNAFIPDAENFMKSLTSELS